MAKEKVDLERQVYSKTEYTKIIDTRFNQLGVVSIPDQINNVFTVTEFFEKYNELFYDIPAEGDINSHAYLVQTSGEYIGFNKDNEEIQALQLEISQLRRDLLAAEIRAAEAVSGQTININPDNIEVEDDGTFTQTLADLNTQLGENNEAPTIVSNEESNVNNPVSTPATSAPSLGGRPTSAPSGGGGGGGGGGGY
tara:strand:- start:7869 stop:8456 length:588 start_codon:yes stop_codon:yes gene_type:complete